MNEFISLPKNTQSVKQERRGTDNCVHLPVS